MIDEYNLAEDNVEYIDGNMELGTESPLEMNENKNVRKMNESQFRNLVYEMTLKMLDEQLNEDDPMAAGTPPVGPMAAGGAAGAPMDPMAAGGAVAPMPQATDADADGLPGKYLKIANNFKTKKAQEIGDKSGGAPGFNPKDEGDDKDKDDDKKKDKDKKKHKDKEKKELAERIAKSVFNQILEEFGHK